MDTVDKQIEGGEATRQEGPPPPVVILGTKVEVAEQYRRFWACYDQDDEHQKQKSKHVVDLTWPDAIQNKEKLNENASKGQHATHDDAR